MINVSNRMGEGDSDFLLLASEQLVLQGKCTGQSQYCFLFGSESRDRRFS